MKRLSVRSIAKRELRAAIAWYRREDDALALRFEDRVSRCVDWIRRFPLAPRARSGGIRFVSVEDFPFNVCYTVEADRIVVVAILHHRRGPDALAGRVSTPE